MGVHNRAGAKDSGGFGWQRLNFDPGRADLGPIGLVIRSVGYFVGVLREANLGPTKPG